LYGSGYFDILLLDSLYSQAPVLKLAEQIGWDVVISLKQEKRDLYQDALGTALFTLILVPQITLFQIITQIVHAVQTIRLADWTPPQKSMRLGDQQPIVVPCVIGIEPRRLCPNWDRHNGPILAAANRKQQYPSLKASATPTDFPRT
jgi:hypothetical protein